jgi:apolipoprotein D and lipocalin family protein
MTADGPPVPLANVDLSRIYGGWYILATIPNWFERGIVENYDHYSAGPNGTVHEDFYMRDGGFNKKRQHLVTNIEVLPGTGNADWRVKPIWPVSLPFQILYVDPQYRFVLFGEQDRSLGWIYAREKIISDADFRFLMDRFSALGYDTSKFRKVIQFPEQICQPGFWSDKVQPDPAAHNSCDPR